MQNGMILLLDFPWSDDFFACYSVHHFEELNIGKSEFMFPIWMLITRRGFIYYFHFFY